MPPLILLAAAGIGIYAGYRMVRGVLGKIDSGAVRQAGAEREVPAPRDLGSLERDPASGVYRPRK